MFRRCMFAFTLSVWLAGSAVAHDLYIMPERFRVSSGESVTIGFHSGDAFPNSQQTPRRLRDAALNAGGRAAPMDTLNTDGNRMTAKAVVPATGHIIATVVAAAATIEMKPDEFLEYLKEEGLTGVIDWRAKNNEAAKPARERYTKYAKSILLSGKPNDAYKHVVGSPIEIVPQKDPYQIKPGESLPVQVLFRGKPARGLELRIASPQSGKNESAGTTDADGKISIPIKSAGPWRLHTIVMERCADAAAADWESFWATLTFEVR